MARVWHTGRYTDEAGRAVPFRVQDVSAEHHDRLARYYAAEFFADEVICKHIRMPEDQVSVSEYVGVLRGVMRQGYSLVALEEPADGGEPEIVGAAMYIVLNDGDSSPLQGEGRSIRTLLAMFSALKAPGRTPPRYMTGLGMWVRRDRRRRGLAEAIVRAALASCRGKAVPHFSAVYSSTASQRAAAKAGLQDQVCVPYTDITDADGSHPLSDMLEKYCKLMGTDVDPDPRS